MRFFVLLFACWLSCSSGECQDAMTYGFEVVSIDDELKEILKKLDLKMPPQGKIMVDSVVEGGPAAAAGLTQFAAIVSIGSERLPSLAAATSIIQQALKDQKPLVLSVYQLEKDNKGRTKWIRESINVTPISLNELLRLRFKREHDPIREWTTVHHIESPTITQTGFSVFFVIKDGELHTALECRYSSKNYFGLQELLIKTDQSTYSFKREIWQKHTHIGGGGVYEWFTIPLDSKNLSLVEELASNKKPLVRFVGTNFRDDIDLSNEDTNRFREIASMRRVLLGELAGDK